MYKINKFKIKFSKKISKKKLKNFFKIKGLGKLLDFVDDDFDPMFNKFRYGGSLAQ